MFLSLGLPTISAAVVRGTRADPKGQRLGLSGSASGKCRLPPAQPPAPGTPPNITV